LEMHDMRADAGGKGISIYALRSDADFNAVMRVPELVLRHDWPARTGDRRLHQREALTCAIITREWRGTSPFPCISSSAASRRASRGLR
jgi:hypothetical protein